MRQLGVNDIFDEQDLTIGQVRAHESSNRGSRKQTKSARENVLLPFAVRCYLDEIMPVNQHTRS